MADLWTSDPRETLRVGPDFDLATFDRASRGRFTGRKRDAERLIAERGALLAELQERLYANGRAGGTENVLIIVQGLDTAGKGGIARHVMGLVDPQGVALRSFGVPTPEERSHHYLWRIKKALPKPGQIGLFDRSHYEDVLVARVDELVEPEVWSKRFDEINKWEKSLVDSGTRILKFALMVSYQEQAKRLMERLDRPDKRWKYSMSDLKTRANWDAYQEAYSDVFRLTSTARAPWHVLPADTKWFSRLVVTEFLTRTLIEMDLQWPRPRWQPEAQRKRLVATMTPQALAESLSETRATVLEAMEASIDVNEDAAELKTHRYDDLSRDAAFAAIEAKRAFWENDLATTLRQKRELLQAVAPELVPADPSTDGSSPTAEKSAGKASRSAGKGKSSGKGKKGSSKGGKKAKKSS